MLLAEKETAEKHDDRRGNGEDGENRCGDGTPRCGPGEPGGSAASTTVLPKETRPIGQGNPGQTPLTAPHHTAAQRVTPTPPPAHRTLSET